MFTFPCQKCGEVYHSEPAHVGRKMRCRRCGRLITIDNPEQVSTQPPTAPEVGSTVLLVAVILLVALAASLVCAVIYRGNAKP